MKKFLTNLRKIIVNGFIFLIPVFVIFVIVTKAFTAMTSVGAKVAGIFGMKSIMGINVAGISTSLLLILICLLCGLLVKFSFMKAFSRATENTLAKYIPGYTAYKEMAEEKLQLKTRELPYQAALIMQSGYWQPAFIIEQDDQSNYVVFLPDIPETNKGQVLLAKQDQVKMLSTFSANQLDASLKKMGKGLLNEHRINIVMKNPTNNVS